MSEQELVDGMIAAQETGIWDEFFAWCRERGFRFMGDPWFTDTIITTNPGDNWIVYANSGSVAPWSYTAWFTA